MDVCRGGKNGKPKLTAKQLRLETAKVWLLALGIVAFFMPFVIFIALGRF